MPIRNDFKTNRSSQSSPFPVYNKDAAPPRIPAYDTMVQRLMLPELHENVDRYFLKDESIPRIVMCNTSDLVHTMLGIEPTQFNEQAQNALVARSERLSFRTLFDHD
ncbi:BQ2448_3253 [Microbotryum intermedium]|uniref:BQ2448_3253 protein n=1 Tax=Microbotryum intermedium TaxID=269621 RepID=A0A238FEP3_9BASI|nr:BQ2448_3253 [Microbotryum intermedium]